MTVPYNPDPENVLPFPQILPKSWLGSTKKKLISIISTPSSNITYCTGHKVNVPRREVQPDVQQVERPDDLHLRDLQQLHHFGCHLLVQASQGLPQDPPGGL